MKKHYFSGLKKAVPTLYRSNFTKIVLLFYSLFFLLLCQAQGQEYRPLAVDGAQWIVRMDSPETMWPVEDLWEYYCNGDTILDGLTYAKIYKRSLVVTQDPPPFDANGEYQLSGFIRDDIANRKVYAIAINAISECPANEEFLMFDFSLQPGDPFKLCLIPDAFPEDTLTYISEDGAFGFITRVFYTLNGQIGYEGIGSDHGLFEMMFSPVKSKSKANTMLERTFMYYYCREAPCNLVVSVPEQASEKTFTITPNPAYEKIRLTLTSEKVFQTAIIYDARGIEQERLTLQPGTNEYDISVRHLPAGVYVVGLFGDAQQATKTKLVICNY
jgi:hypothetical protein